MLIISVANLENGGHDNQCSSTPIPLPEGWAVVPKSLGTIETLENFPYGEITVEDVEGVPTVTSWTPLPVPEPEPLPDSEPTPEEQNARLRAQVAMLQEQQTFLENCLLEMAEEVYA